MIRLIYQIFIIKALLIEEEGQYKWIIKINIKLFQKKN